MTAKAKKNSTLLVISLIVAGLVILGGVIYLIGTNLYKPLSDDQIKEVALVYAKSKCKESKAEASFCDNLQAKVGEKSEDSSAVFWTVNILSGENGSTYSGLFVDSNNGNPSVRPGSYILSH